MARIIAGVFIVVLGPWGLALILRGAQIVKGRRGSTIAVFVLALIPCLLASFLLGWIILDLFYGANFSPDMFSLIFLLLEFCIAVSGLLTSWFCIQTLRHWPSPAGTAFEVEFPKQIPTQEGDSHERNNNIRI